MIQFLKSIIWNSRRRGIVILSVALASSVLLFSSCFFNRPLKYNKGTDATVTVKFDWTEVEGEKPNNMSLWFFPRNDATKAIVRRNVENVKNGAVTVKIPFGEYDVICVNNDPNRLEYRNEKNPYEFEVVLKAVQPYTSDIPALGVWRDVVTNLDFVLDSETYELNLAPKPIAKVLSVELIVNDRFNEIKDISGIIRDVITIYYPYENKFGEEENNLVFKFLKTSQRSNSGKLLGDCIFFVHEHNNSCSHFLDINLELNGGALYTYNYNVTSELKNFSANLDIVLKNNDFRLPTGTSTEFQISNWNDIQIQN